MAQVTDAGDGEQHTAAIPVGNDTHRAPPRRGFGKTLLDFIPWLTYVLILYVLGALYFNGPRATMFTMYGHPVSWATVVIFIAGLVCMLEIFKVSKPGVDNSAEVFVMLGFAGFQAILIALSQAYPDTLWFMRTPENLMLMALNGLQGFVALRVNARSLVRTIAGSPVAG